MAQSDLDAMVVVGTDDPKTAEDNIGGLGPEANDVENAAAAAAHGVWRASFINYDVALDKYAARDDVEDLAHKNARDIPADFADASFMRTTTGAAGSGSSA
jgi:hypothetical protein